MIFSMGKPKQAVLQDNLSTITGNISFPAAANTFLGAGWVFYPPQTQFASAALGNSAVYFAVEFDSNPFRADVAFRALDSDTGIDGVHLVSYTTTLTDNPINKWHSFAFSIDLSSFTCHFLADLIFADLSAGGPNAPNMWVSYPDVHHIAPGFDTWELDFFNSGLYTFRASIGEPFFSLNNPTNVAKLFASGNHPVGWGSDGSRVTGTSPQVFLTGDHTKFLDNAGTGGSFSIVDSVLTDIPAPT